MDPKRTLSGKVARIGLIFVYVAGLYLLPLTLTAQAANPQPVASTALQGSPVGAAPVAPLRSLARERALAAARVAALLPRALLFANPAPVQIFYLTLPENDALTVLSAINAAAVTPVNTYFSIAIGVNGTKVYYDQWENGYDSDIANPTNLYNATTNPGGTQIWGNSNCSDGYPPNKAGVA